MPRPVTVREARVAILAAKLERWTVQHEARERAAQPGALPYLPYLAEQILDWVDEDALGAGMRATERVVGTVSLLHIYPEQDDAEVGYWLGVAGRGRGLARRAVALLCDWAFVGLGLERLHLMVDLDNAASHAVALACDFKPTREVFWEHPTDPSKSATVLLYERMLVG